MADSTDVLIAVADENNQAIYFNQAWAKLTGRSVSDFIRFGWVDILLTEDRDSLVAKIIEAMQTKEPFNLEMRILNKNGQYRWLYRSEVPRFNIDGGFAGFIASGVDITGRKEDEQRKSNFINMVSHGLKTPLTSINGYVQLLQIKAERATDTATASILNKTGNQVKK